MVIKPQGPRSLMFHSHLPVLLVKRRSFRSPLPFQKRRPSCRYSLSHPGKKFHFSPFFSNTRLSRVKDGRKPIERFDSEEKERFSFRERKWVGAGLCISKLLTYCRCAQTRLSRLRSGSVNRGEFGRIQLSKTKSFLPLLPRDRSTTCFHSSQIDGWLSSSYFLIVRKKKTKDGLSKDVPRQLLFKRI